MAEVSCDKGPLLDQILNGMSSLRRDQSKMVDAVVDIARHQERIISLADRTEKNQHSIELLFTLQRETEAQIMNDNRDMQQKLVDHMLNHPSPDTCNVKKVFSRNEDGKFDKVQIAVITTVLGILIHSAWDILYRMVKSVASLAQTIGV